MMRTGKVGVKTKDQTIGRIALKGKSEVHLSVPPPSLFLGEKLEIEKPKV
jgi:hypothetical protein